MGFTLRIGQSTARHCPRNYLKNLTLKYLFFCSFTCRGYVLNLLYFSRQTSTTLTLTLNLNYKSER